MTPTTVPFLDLRPAHAELRAPIEEAVLRVARSGSYLLGNELSAFEEEFARYSESPHAIGVASGLDALILALDAAGVKPGDEVIVPANTYIATWLAVSRLGAVPVGVEPRPGSWTMDPRAVSAAITSRTTTLLPVHLYGQPADLDPLLDLARRKNLIVVEDAAQCHGARYRGRRVGAHGDAVAWSFYPSKNLGAFGDGGAVTTPRADIADRVRVLRNYGSRVKYYNEVRGYNSRLDEIQAAVLRAKLPMLDAWNERRAQIAGRFLDVLRDVPGLRLPTIDSDRSHVFHLFVVDHDRRDDLKAHLEREGVGTSIHYPVPPHLSDAYSDANIPRGAFPITERAAETHLSLPIGPHVSAEQVDAILRACTGWRAT